MTQPGIGETDSSPEATPTTDAPDAPGEATEEDTAEPSRTIQKEDGFHVLQNSRRRAVLRHLLEQPDRERFRMRDVAEAVAAWEHDTTVRQLDSDERQRVYIALYQSHLPKLDKHDVIDYNQSRGVIEVQPLIDAFDPYLEDGLDADCDELVVPESTQSSGVDADGTDGSDDGTVADRLIDLVGS